MVQLDEANAELKLSKASMEAEVAKGLEADTLIKSLDLKLTNLRNEVRERDEQVAALTETATDATQRCGEALLEAKQAKEAVPDPEATASVDDVIVNAFEEYYNLKRTAERSKGTPDAAHHHALAMRAYGALTSGTTDTPMVLSCCVDAPDMCEDEEEHVMATSAAARTALREALPATRSSGTHRDLDCPVELATTGTPTDTTPLALKMRTQAYVNAVSKDLRRGLMHASRQWITAAGGELPPLPADLVLHAPDANKPDHPPEDRVPGQE